MMLFETRAPDAPRPVGPHDGAALASLHAPLDDALHLLQADPGHSLADPGLARLTQAGLDRLFVAARRQADRSHQGILLLLDLLPLAQRADPATSCAITLKTSNAGRPWPTTPLTTATTAKSPNASPRDCCRSDQRLPHAALH